MTLKGEFLRNREEEDWWALEKFKAEGAARVHFTFKCQDEAAARALHDRLKSLTNDHVEMRLVSDTATPSANNLEQLKEMREILSEITGQPPSPKASTIVLTSDPGWRVEMRTDRISDRQQLAQMYRSIRELLEDPRWTWEGGGVGP